jgi:hypothetical protein
VEVNVHSDEARLAGQQNGKHPSLRLHSKSIPGSHLGGVHFQRMTERYQWASDDGSVRALGVELLVGAPFIELFSAQ